MKKIIISAVLSLVSVVAFAQGPVAAKEQMHQDHPKGEMHVMNKHHRHAHMNHHHMNHHQMKHHHMRHHHMKNHHYAHSHVSSQQHMSHPKAEQVVNNMPHGK